MKQLNRIAVLGGTGKSGQYLVKQLIQQGIDCKILVRNPNSFRTKEAPVELVQGDARDERAIRSLVEGCQSVVSLLGQPQGELPVCSQATRHILLAMPEYRIRRYILVAGLNVDTPFDQKSTETKLATDWMKTHYPAATADRQAEYQLLSDSDALWTLVRLPLIEQTDRREAINVSLEDCPGQKISATSLAHFLIEQLSDNRYIRKAPFIADSPA